MRIKSSFAVACASGLALSAAAVAQPASTDLGTLSNGNLNVPNISIGAGQIVWYRFTLTNPIPAGGSVFLDIDTEGSALAPTNDTELGLYDSAGNLIANDDDDGTDFLSQLTFGSTTPRRAPGNGAAYNGRDGALNAGTYYLSVSGYNTAFGATGWNVTSTSTYTGTANLNLSHGVLGACCYPDGTCALTSAATCTAAGGIYRGENTSCATANCPQPPGQWPETSDAGDLPGTAQVTVGNGSLTSILGTLATDSDMFQIQICDPASFGATTVNNATTIDTQLFLFSADGRGVVMNDDTSDTPIIRQSTISNLGVGAAGTYYIAVSTYNKDPQDASNQLLWTNDFYLVHAPDGPGAPNPIASWTTGGGSGAYRITLTGACFAQPGGGNTCYPNCDHSTNVPFLNVLDFNCFVNAYTAGDSYANCDGSTQPPILNVLDFNCFVNAYTAGCSAP
jgi:hypothetical protein